MTPFLDSSRKTSEYEINFVGSADMKGRSSNRFRTSFTAVGTVNDKDCAINDSDKILGIDSGRPRSPAPIFVAAMARSKLGIVQIARPVTTSLLKNRSSAPIIIHQFFYGENEPHALQATNNLKGQCVRQYDAAGVVEHEAFEFKGNLTQMKRSLAKDYKNDLDWTDLLKIGRSPTTYVASGTFDALNRQIETTLPDSTVVHQACTVIPAPAQP